jgi:hypothetical protein
MPTIYWVVADDTGAGKTTISCALIRVLNRLGIRALGFKPFGGTNLKENIDFILDQYPRSECMVYGTDAVKLAKASPLTSSDMVEVVGPSYRLIDPRVRKCVLMRKGARMLGNRSFFQPKAVAEYQDRPDVRRLVERAKLPFHEATLVAQRTGAGLDLIQPEKVAAAFAHLVSLGPEAIVCEGASGRLPFWSGCPAVNHVLFVGDSEVRLFPRADLSFRPRRSLLDQLVLGGQRVPATETLWPTLHRRVKRPATRTIELVESPRREAYTDELVAALLKSAGLPSRASGSPPLNHLPLAPSRRLAA